jgi:hypothetical protein
MSASHLTRQAPDLTEEKAKQLEIKLEVAMAEIQSVGGDRDESAKGAIDKISRIGRSAVMGSIDWYPSQRQTPAELVEIERGSGGATQSPGLGRERRKKRARGCGWSVRPKPPGWVRPGRLALTGGPGPTGGPGLAGEFERFLIKF